MIAKIIVDITHESVDRAFDYIVPENLIPVIKKGSQVNIPFGKGNTLRKGFVVGFTEESKWPVEKLKAIDSVIEKGVPLEGTMIELADFIRENYGGTMSQALKTVLPVKVESKPITEKYIYLKGNPDEVLEKYSNDRRSHAKRRLLFELVSEKILPKEIVRDRLNISDATIRALEKEGLIGVDIKTNLRDALNLDVARGYSIQLNEDQRAISDGIWDRFNEGDKRPSLIRGVTGSGKTEIYIDLIDKMISQGRQAVVLIPEIALTYQTVLRFYKKFGDRVSVINSKLTQAQKHDQFEKARNGMVDIIIGPRSALFTPFNNLGIIIIDEEHEGTYKNENIPRYHSREVAIERTRLSGGITVLGSATPSVDSYYKAEKGDYQLYTLSRRARGASLPEVRVIDMRAELNDGNRSIVSRQLKELITDRLEKHEQVMLFINRRGYSSFVSCRNCGEAIKCPHCDVSLKLHKPGDMLVCHYCGYETPLIKKCPKCGSKYIGTWGTGTQKVEEEIKTIFPQAKTLRMDFDTTKEKDGHRKILESFANHEADILVGTQMIVKGHDFEDVTLVGIMAADMSLYSESYEAPERTFQLLTQAAGRAGRGEKKGDVVIQTYSPDNYAITLGARQDYQGFYEFEMDYRNLLGYPPAMNMVGIWISSADEKKLDSICREISDILDKKIADMGGQMFKIGPTPAPIFKVSDRFRKVMYLKAKGYSDLTAMKDVVEQWQEAHPDKDILISHDFSTIGG